jgi:hypothetical protein
LEQHLLHQAANGKRNSGKGFIGDSAQIGALFGSSFLDQRGELGDVALG